jgi:hypothetical protein
VLKWNRIKLNLISLQSTLTYVHQDKYIHIKQSLNVVGALQSTWTTGTAIYSDNTISLTSGHTFPYVAVSQTYNGFASANGIDQSFRDPGRGVLWSCRLRGRGRLRDTLVRRRRRHLLMPHAPVRRYCLLL